MADKLISATTSGDDLIFKVNVSGTPTEAMRILGTDGSVSGNITPSGITTETNMLTSASSTASGWTGTNATVTTTTTTGDLPLNGVVSTAIQIASSTLNGYAAVPFSIPEGLKNTKLKVEFYQRPASGYLSNDFKVEVWNSGLTTEYSLSTDSSGTSGLPSMTGKYNTTFDTDSNTSYKLLVKRTVASAATINLSKVVIGPGIQPQGAVVSPEISFTPGTFGGPAPSSTLTLDYAKYVRVGERMQVQIRWYVAAFNYVGSAQAANSVSIDRLIPTGFTIPTAFYSGGRSGFGKVTACLLGTGAYTSHAYVVGFIEYDGTATPYRFLVNTKDTGTSAESCKPIPWGSFGSPAASGPGYGFIQLEFEVPISEWSGSGTVNLAQNDVEYASNSNATNTATDTTSFAYGPAGSNIPNGATGTAYARDVKFQSPIQSTDRLFLEFRNAASEYFVALESSGPIGAYTRTGASSFYGVSLARKDANTVTVTFQSGGRTVYGQPFSDESTSFWRVRKTSAGAAVGFGIVNPGVSAGLVSANGLPGRTDGVVIGTPYVGATVLNTQNSACTATYGGAAQVVSTGSLTAGAYLLSCNISIGNATRPTAGIGSPSLSLKVNGVTVDSQPFTIYWYPTVNENETSQGFVTLMGTVVVPAGATHTVNVEIAASAASGTPTNYQCTARNQGYLKAIRIY